MKLGVIFPQLEIGTDPSDIRAFAEAVEGLGYDYLTTFEHVLGVDPARHEGWRGPYTNESMFHEPFVLFGYLAAVTKRIQLVTGVLVLTQRQTVIVAKQAAEVDVLSGGRLVLGVGAGWHQLQIEALGHDFHNRGRRLEEQIAVLRALWLQPVVEFDGRWHHIHGMGINPLPVQQSIPVWLGGGAEPVLKRIARIGDGWLVNGRPDDSSRAALARLRDYTKAAGRDPAKLAIAPVVSLSRGDLASQSAEAAAWRELGATHLQINTMRAGLKSVDQHIKAITEFKRAMAN